MSENSEETSLEDILSLLEEEVHSSGGRIEVTYWDGRKNCSFEFEAVGK